MSYYTKITTAGLAAITASINNSSKVPITYMAFGDGNGYVPDPDEDATSLVNEVYRVGVNKVEVHSKNPNWLVCEAIIPSAVGGFNIREVALYDSTGNIMLAIASYPPTYKPTVEEGAAKIQTIRIVIQVDNSGNFELIVDPDVVLATRQDIEEIKEDIFEIGLNFESYTEMTSYAAVKDGMKAFLKSYHEGLGYGSGWYIYSESKQKWIIQPVNSSISIEQFGAICGPKPSATFNVFPEQTTDNTAAVKAAFEYAKLNGLKLIAENNQCFFFENMASLQLYGDVECDFNGSLFFFSVAMKADPKNDPSIQISGARREVSNLDVTTNAYMSKAFEFNKALSDNQALTVKKLRAYSCRYGVSVTEGECINRMRFENCEFTSNYYAGVYVNSFDTSWVHSAPVFFRDTIINGNGPQNWIITSNAQHNLRTGGSIAVRDTDKDVGQQAFFRGVSGLHYLGGQLSCHGGARNTSLITLKNINMVTIDATDIEDISCYSLDGTKLTVENYLSYANETSGAAIVADACVGLSVRSLNLFSIDAPAVLKVMNNPGSYEYRVATALSGFAYTVWDLSNPSNGIGSCDIHPYAIAYGNGVSPIAFANAANKESISSVIHHEQAKSDFSVDWMNLKKQWQNGQSNSENGYLLTYLSNHDQPLTDGPSGHLYNEFVFPTQISSSSPSDYAKWIFADLMHNQSADGRFVLQALDVNNNILASQWHNPGETTHYPVSNWVRMKIPSGTRKVRFGFVNSKNYLGYIKSHYWNGSPRYSDWHTTVYLVHDGNGAMRNKIRANFSACIDEYRQKLIYQSSNVTDSSATDVSGLNVKINELLQSLRSSGVMKTS